MILIVSLPICLADETKEEELTAEEGYTDIVINVKKYEPTVIVSSLLEEQNIPIYAFLSAMPTEGSTLPRIQSVSVSVIGGNKSNLIGGAQYFKPVTYDWNDLGYIEVKLKKIEKEAKIPDKIDVDLKAKIRYEGESTSAVVGGVETRELKEIGSIELGDLLKNKDFMFFGGKGYIRTEKIVGKTATFVLYNGEGEQVSRFSVNEGKESSAFNLVRGSTEPEDFVRVRVDEVVDKTQPSIVVNMDNEDYTAFVGNEIRGWIVKNIDTTKNEIELQKDKLTVIYGTNINLEDESVKEFIKDWGNFKITAYNKGEKKEAKFNIDSKPIAEGSPLGSKGCVLNKIESDYVEIKENGKSYYLYLKTEIERERESSYSYTGQIRHSDTLDSGICNGMIRLVDIDTKRSVRITLMTGKREGYTESVFSLHLPVEKRIVDLSPRALDRRINKTREQIESLNKKYINNLEKVVKEWRKVCLIVTATFLVYNFFKGALTKSATQQKIEDKEAKTKEIIKKFKEGGNLKPVGGSSKFNELVEFRDALGNKVYVLEEDMSLFYNRDEKTGQFSTLTSSVIYHKNVPVYWSDKGEGWLEYSGLDKGELNRILVTEIGEQKATIIPFSDKGNLPSILKQQYTEWKITGTDVEKGIYAVVYDDRVEVWQGRGSKIDVLDKNKDDELDRMLTSWPKSDPRGAILYRDLDNMYLSKIRRAQQEGKKSLDINNKKYAVDATSRFLSTKLSCKDVFEGWQCTLLFNACDPVICPASRCNWNGEYNVKNVVQSGLIGSTYLCLGNSIVMGGEVIIPFCLSGILASLKNIRSYLEQYEKCLTKARNEGQSTGICDKISSIYICEIIWKEMMNFFNLKGGILGLITRKIFGSGGGEYFENPIESGIDKSAKAVDFFVNDYATEMFAAYVGRSTEEIGTELCKNAIAGKFPNLGEFMEEIAEPEDPVQFTAYFEEHAYAPTKGESRYQVYYHIYAGNPKRTESVDYKVYLQSKGKPTKMVDQGTLKAGESADETIDIIALSGYQEICVVINGVAKCGFGKSVSTSFFLEEASNWYMKEAGGLAPTITKASQCVSEGEKAGTAAGYVPKAAVERVCAISNPYLGLGQYKEKEWYVVGKCIDEDGRNLGQCWQRADLTRYPELKESVSEDICVEQGGQWCNVNQTCKDGAVAFEFDDDEGHKECCIGGECVKREETKIATTIGRVSQETETKIKEIINGCKSKNEECVGGVETYLSSLQLAEEELDKATKLAEDSCYSDVQIYQTKINSLENDILNYFKNINDIAISNKLKEAFKITFMKIYESSEELYLYERINFLTIWLNTLNEKLEEAKNNQITDAVNLNKGLFPTNKWESKESLSQAAKINIQNKLNSFNKVNYSRIRNLALKTEVEKEAERTIKIYNYILTNFDTLTPILDLERGIITFNNISIDGIALDFVIEVNK